MVKKNNNLPIKSKELSPMIKKSNILLEAEENVVSKFYMELDLSKYIDVDKYMTGKIRLNNVGKRAIEEYRKNKIKDLLLPIVAIVLSIIAIIVSVLK